MISFVLIICMSSCGSVNFVGEDILVVVCELDRLPLRTAFTAVDIPKNRKPVCNNDDKKVFYYYLAVVIDPDLTEL